MKFVVLSCALTAAALTCVWGKAPKATEATSTTVDPKASTVDPKAIVNIELTFRPEYQNKTLVEAYAKDLVIRGASTAKVLKDLKIDATVSQALKAEIILDDLADVVDV